MPPIEILLLSLSAFFTFVAALLVWRAPKIKTVSHDEMTALLASLRDELRTETDNLRGDVADVRAEIAETRSHAQEIGTSVGELRTGISETRNENMTCFRELHGNFEKSITDLHAFLEKSLAGTRTEHVAMRTELARTMSDQFKLLNDTLQDQFRRLSDTIQSTSDRLSGAQAEHRRAHDESFAKVNSSLDQVSSRVDKAVADVQANLLDLARQHNEAKAQTAIQFCETLIGSLGNLRNQIAASIAAPRENEMISPPDAEATMEPLNSTGIEEQYEQVSEFGSEQQSRENAEAADPGWRTEGKRGEESASEDQPQE